MYVRTDGHLRPALIGRRGSDKSTYKITRESSWSPYPCTPYSARHEIVLPAKQLDLLNSLMHIMASRFFQQSTLYQSCKKYIIILSVQKSRQIFS